MITANKWGLSIRRQCYRIVHWEGRLELELKPRTVLLCIDGAISGPGCEHFVESPRHTTSNCIEKNGSWKSRASFPLSTMRLRGIVAHSAIPGCNLPLFSRLINLVFLWMQLSIRPFNKQQTILEKRLQTYASLCSLFLYNQQSNTHPSIHPLAIPTFPLKGLESIPAATEQKKVSDSRPLRGWHGHKQPFMLSFTPSQKPEQLNNNMSPGRGMNHWISLQLQLQTQTLGMNHFADNWYFPTHFFRLPMPIHAHGFYCREDQVSPVGILLHLLLARRSRNVPV